MNYFRGNFPFMSDAMSHNTPLCPGYLVLDFILSNSLPCVELRKKFYSVCSNQFLGQYKWLCKYLAGIFTIVLYELGKVHCTKLFSPSFVGDFVGHILQKHPLSVILIYKVISRSRHMHYIIAVKQYGTLSNSTEILLQKCC